MGTSTMLARCLALLAFVAAVSAGDTSSITGLATAIESGYRAMHDHALKLEQEWHKQQVAVQKKEEDLRQKYVDLDNEAADLDRQEQQKRANKYNEMRNAQLEYQKVVAKAGQELHKTMVAKQRELYDQYTAKDRELDLKYNQLDRDWDKFQHEKANLWTVRHQAAASFRDQYTQLVYRAGQLGSALTHPGFGASVGASPYGHPGFAAPAPMMAHPAPVF